MKVKQIYVFFFEFHLIKDGRADNGIFQSVVVLKFMVKN